MLPFRCRSALFVPAANARALARSATLIPDALIFDLEDSAGPDEKARAREDLREHLRTRQRGGPEPRVVVRINPLAGPFGTEDLLMARAVMPDAILLPKVERPGDLEEVAAALADTDAPETLELWAMVETPKGLLEAPRIAEAGTHLSHRLAALVAGPNDLVAALGLRLSAGRPELVPHLASIVLAARAQGLAALDGVFNDPADEAGLAAEASQGRALGFGGKTLIHPRQIAAANAAFAPTAQEIAAARAVVEAFARPEAEGRGVLSLGGRMVERLHLRVAERLLAEAGEAIHPDRHGS